MRKRQKMVLSALILSLGMVVVQYVGLEWKYWMIGIMTAVSWLFSAWSLKEGLAGVEWLMVPLPATMFTASVGLFYILLPESWWAKLMVFTMFGVGQYALLLSGNIFSVAAIRTIALFRAALAVGFVMTLVTAFFLFDSLLSFKTEFWWLGLGVGGFSFLLLLPALWSVQLKETLRGQVLTYSLWLAVAMGVTAVAVSFWPVNIAVTSLFLTTCVYVYLGIVQHHFMDRLFAKTVWEYVTVGVVVLVTMLATSLIS